MRHSIFKFALLLATAGCNQILDIPEVQPDRVPHIAQVKVDGQGDSTQVRQGAGTITLVVTGVHLDTLGEARLGSWPAILVDALPESVRLTVDVPHGAPTGPLELVLTGAAGDANTPGAVTITGITAAPAGNDATGAGTSERPFRSLRQALAVAAAGDAIFLKDGNYGVASGEVWPEHPEDPAAPAPPSVPAGITIEGESMTGTVLEGSGDPDVLDTGLILAGQATIKKLTLSKLSRAILITGGVVELESVTVLDTQAQALVVLGTAEVNVRDSLFAGGSDRGVLVSGSANVRLERAEVSRFLQEGIRIGDDATVTLTEVDVHHNGDGLETAGVLLGRSWEGGVLVSGKATVTIEASRIRDNFLTGIRILDATRFELIDSEVFRNGHTEQQFRNGSYGLVAQYGHVVVKGGEIHDNLGTAIELIDVKTATVTDALLQNNVGTGITVVRVGATKVRGTRIVDVGVCCAVFLTPAGVGTIDFGTASDPGLNQLSSGQFAIRDTRTPGTIATFIGTEINGRLLPPGVVEGVTTIGPDYHIGIAGSRLEF